MSQQKILVAVDLSQGSQTLLQYVKSSTSPSDEIHAIHVRDEGYMGMDVIGGDNPFAKEKLTLRKLVNEVFDNRTVHCEVVFNPIDPGSGIIQYSQKHEINTIYIGPREKHNFLDKILGSTCIRVVNDAPCDVVVVPPRMTYHPIKTMVIAANADFHQILSPSLLSKWRNKMLYFIHIGHSTADFDKEKKALLSKLFEDNNVDFSFGIEVIDSNEPVKAILSFAHQENADAVLLRKSDQSLISTLFLKSTSKEIIEKSILPLIFLNSK